MKNLFYNPIRATPEHTFGLTIALLRNYKHIFCKGNISLQDREQFKGYEIYKKRIGIIGFGRVGKILSNYFNSFGAEVQSYDIKKIQFPQFVTIATQ